MEGERILDGTLFEHGGRYYLFCGQAVSGSDNLYLYVGESLEGPYTSHPCNPVVMNPAPHEWAGVSSRRGGKLYRFGQNNSYGYGSSLAVNEIEVLDPGHYSEKRVANLAFQDARGPHTIDIHGQTMILDFYQDNFRFWRGIAVWWPGCSARAEPFPVASKLPTNWAERLLVVETHMGQGGRQVAVFYVCVLAGRRICDVSHRFSSLGGGSFCGFTYSRASEGAASTSKYKSGSCRTVIHQSIALILMACAQWRCFPSLCSMPSRKCSVE